MKLADGLETLMPEFYKYIASIQDYNDAMKYTDSDAILPILVTDQNGNSTILWVMAFQMDSYFAVNSQATAILCHLHSSTMMKAVAICWAWKSMIWI